MQSTAVRHQVPMKYVHLSREESVLLTGWRMKDAHHAVVGAQWQKVPRDPGRDLRLLAQTIRQSGLLITHAERAVPLDWHTVMNALDITLPGRLPKRTDGPTPLRVEIACKEKGPRALQTRYAIFQGGDGVGDMGQDMDGDMGRDGFSGAGEAVTGGDESPLFLAEAELGWISPGGYERLRGARFGDKRMPAPPVPVSPALVDRTHEREVVLSPSPVEGRWRLRVDPANRMLYDHPVDHAPGLSLMEAAQQAAHALFAPGAFRLATVSSEYHLYVNHDEPCWIDAAVTSTSGAATTVLVTGEQGGKVNCRFTLTGTVDKERA
ncbi:ScbA/BarX family gamma-butyrolactone biosynthesis protein [Streptomyces iconiensis]|uniref:ScbA/BarX family gamma-butyrolactone biosynthesis protein n=1 Tax=Streptomyces iconiensis TaxID=1384038 RepID=A0ABT7A0W6_9ACTN|nr:ScbA/BarX family gamma-butyrolactone biosynthesis protein [Streptomyces iconiensis]MDJ1134977.1 ScbA/BarX family gamma-butyrolactone biosynthesis protein [Streptomyces iconiensis]